MDVNVGGTFNLLDDWLVLAVFNSLNCAKND